MIRGKKNCHRIFTISGGKFRLFTTHEEDFLPNLAALFSNLNARTVIRQGAQSALALVLVLLMLAQQALALPTGWEVVSGDVTFQVDGSTLNVQSNSSQAIVNYQSFNIAGGETVNFFLLDGSSSILNRVIGGGPSSIFGSLNSNGTVLLSNNAGINIGATANINTGSFIASSLNIADQDYLNDNWVFSRDGANPAAVINEGNISAAPGGFVVLGGSAVQNSGNIFVSDGTVHLAAGDKIRVNVSDTQAVEVTVDEALLAKVDEVQHAISNSGTIEARTIELQTELTENLYSKVVNNEGVIRAVTATEEGGVIRLRGLSSDATAIVHNSGTLDASAGANGANGGVIDVSGDFVYQDGTIIADANPNGTAGNIDIASTQETILDAGSYTSAKGNGENSNGGNIIIWSDKDTWFKPDAVIDVSSNTSGDAGFVEVSGAETVYFQGQAYGGAADGQAGKILIDPTNIIIDNVGGNNVTGGDNPGGPDETFAEDPGATVTYDPQAGGAFNGFGDIHLQATNDITVNSAFDTSVATGNGSVSLTLEANNNITINAPLTTNNADINLWADADGNNAGNLTINSTVTSNGGWIELQGSQLDINNTVDAGAGRVYLISSNAKSVVVGNAVDDGDSGAVLDISNPELNRLAGSYGVINAQGADYTVNDNLNIDNAGTGRYHLVFNNASSFTLNGTITNTGRNLEIYSNDIDINDSITAGYMIISSNWNSAETITVGGAIDDNDTGATMDISAAELSRLNGWVSIGDTWNPAATETEVVGNIDLSTAPGITGLELNSLALTTINGTVDTNNRSLTLRGGAIDINQAINAGTSEVYIQSAGGNDINIGGAVDDADAAGTLDISLAEMNRITSASVWVGHPSVNGDVTIIGDLNMDGAGAGKYDLLLRTADNILSGAGGSEIVGGSHIVNLEAGGLINISRTGEIEVNDVSAGGTITLSADSDLNGVGDLILTGDMVGTGGGNILLEGEYVTIDFIASILSNGGSLTLNAREVTGVGDVELGNGSTIDLGGGNLTASGDDFFIDGDFQNVGITQADFSDEIVISNTGSITNSNGTTLNARRNVVVNGAISLNNATLNLDGDFNDDGNGNIDVGSAGTINTGGGALIMSGNNIFMDGAINTNGGSMTTTTDTNSSGTGRFDTGAGSSILTNGGSWTATGDAIHLDGNGGGNTFSTINLGGGTFTATMTDYIQIGTGATEYADIDAGAINWTAGSYIDINHNSTTINANGTGTISMAANTDFTNDGSITNFGNDITIIADNDSNSTGALNINRAITSNGGDIILEGRTAAITSTVNAGAGTLYLRPSVNNTTMGLGGGAMTFQLNNAELALLTADTIELGSNTATGNINLTQANIVASGANLTLNTTGNVTEGGVGDVLFAQNRTFTATGGGGTGIGTIGVDGTNYLDLEVDGGGTLNLDITSNNAVASIALSAQNAVFQDAEIVVDNISTGSGAVWLLAGRINVPGGSAITTTGNVDARVWNTFAGGIDIAGDITGNDINLHINDLTNSGAIDVSGTLTAARDVFLTTTNDNSPITVSGTVDVGRNYSITTGGAASDITLTNTSSWTAQGQRADDYITTAGAGSDIVLDGTLITTSDLQGWQTFIETQDGNITINGTIDNNILNGVGRNMNIETNSASNNITINGTMDVSRDITLRTIGNDSDITIGNMANLSSGDDLRWSTTGDGSDITVNGATLANTDAIAITTDGLNSNITFNTANPMILGDQVDRGGGVDGGAEGFQIATLADDSDISITGDITTNVDTPDITTAGNQSSITYVGDFTANGGEDVTFRTTGLNDSFINHSGGTITGSNILMETTGLGTNNGITADNLTGQGTGLTPRLVTAGDNSDITVTGTQTSNGWLDYDTTGDNSSIIITGDMSAADGIWVMTDGVGSNISLTGNGTSIEVGYETLGNSSDITINGNLTANAGPWNSVNVITNGTDSDISVTGDLTSADYIAVTTALTDSQIDFTGNATATTDLDVTTAGLNNSFINHTGGTLSGDTVTLQTTGLGTNNGITANGITAGTTLDPISTVADNSAITLTGAIAAPNNLVVSTTGDTSDVTFTGTSSANLANRIDVDTSGAGSDIVVDGALQSSFNTANLATPPIDLTTVDGNITVNGSLTTTSGGVESNIQMTTGNGGDVLITGTLDSNRDVRITTNGVDGDIDFNGATVTADDDLRLFTNNDNSHINIVNSTVNYGNENRVETFGNNSAISIDAASSYFWTGAGTWAYFRTNGVNSDISILTDVELATDLVGFPGLSAEITTLGDESSITLDGNFTATDQTGGQPSELVISTAGLNNSTITHTNGTIDADILTLETTGAGTNNGIIVDGITASDTLNPVATAGDNSDITFTGAVNIGSDFDVVTLGDNSSIQFNATASANTPGVINWDTNGAGSDINILGAFNTTYDVAGNEAIDINTQDGSILIDGSINATSNRSFVEIYARGNNRTLTVNGDITGAEADLRTFGNNGTIQINNTAVFDLDNNLVVHTQGDNSDILVNGADISHGRSIWTTTTGLDSDILFDAATTFTFTGIPGPHGTFSTISTAADNSQIDILTDLTMPTTGITLIQTQGANSAITIDGNLGSVDQGTGLPDNMSIVTTGLNSDIIHSSGLITADTLNLVATQSNVGSALLPVTIDANNLQINAGLDAYVTDTDGVNLVTNVSAGGVLQLLAGGDITDGAGLAAISAGDTLWIEANANDGNINLDNDGMAMSGTNGLTLRAENNIFLGQNAGGGSTYSTAGADITIAADTDTNNTGRFSMQENSIINSNGGDISFSVSQFDTEPGISEINAGAGTVTITATTAKKINLNGNGDNDSALVLDIEDVELSRITADTVIIGDTAMAGDMEIVTNALDVSALGNDYNLDLRNAGTISSTLVGDVITAGANNLTINGGDIDFSAGGMSGNVIDLDTSAANLGTLNVNGNITATGAFTANTTGTDSDILFGGTTAGDTITIATTGNDSRISTGALTSNNDLDLDTTGVNADINTGVLTGVNATLDAANDQSSIALGGANLTGDLDVTTAGATFGAITINGATNANDITLTTAGANSNINMYGGNVTASGNLDVTATGSDIVLDLLADRTHQGQNISLTGNAITIARAGTLVEATGSGVGQNLAFDDNGGTPDPAINPGDTINAGGGGLVMIDGDFSSAGTVRAAGGDNGDVTINYATSDLDLTDVTIMAEGEGVIRIINDASGPGNNGTLDEQAGTGAGGAGTISITTANLFDVTGTGADLTGSDITFNVDEHVNLSGVFNASPITATTTNGDFILTDTLTDLELGNLSAAGNIGITANLGSINQAGTINAVDASLSTLGDTSTMTTNGNITLTGDLSMTTAGATFSGITQTGDITAANATFATAGDDSAITLTDAGGGQNITTLLDIDTAGDNSDVTQTGALSATTVDVAVAGSNSDATLNGDVTANTLLMDSTGLNSDLITNGILDVTDTTLTTSAFDADVRVNGNVINGNTLTIATTVQDSDILLDGASVNAGAINLTTTALDSTITSNSDLTGNTLVMSTTPAANGDITQTGDINMTGNVTMSTNGNDADITIDGSVLNADTLRLVTQSGNSAITQINGTITANAVDIDTASQDSAVTVQGMTVTGDVNIHTLGTTSGITQTGDITATNITLSTANDDSAITMTSGAGGFDAGGTIDVNTAGDNSIIDITGAIDANGDVNILTTGDNAGILSDSDMFSWNAVVLETQGVDSDITLTGSTYESNNNMWVYTQGNTSDISITGDLVGTGGADTRVVANGDNTNITINGNVTGSDDAQIENMGGGTNTTIINGNVTTANGLGSDVNIEIDGTNSTLDVTGSLSGGNVYITSLGDGGAITTTGGNITANHDLLVNTNMANSSIDITGNMSAGDQLEVHALAADSTITLNGDLTSTNTIQVDTVGNNGIIDITGNITSTNATTVSSNGDGSTITLAGDVNADDATFSAQGANSDITLTSGAGGFTVTDQFVIDTFAANSGISVTGDVSATDFNVETRQIGSAIDITGDMATGNNVWLRSTMNNSGITVNGDINANRFDMTTSGDNSSVAATGNYTAANLAILDVTGDGSTITVNGNINVTNGTGDLTIDATGPNTAITLNGDASAGDQVDIRTLTDTSHINLNGDVTGTIVNLTATGNGANINQGAANIVNATNLNFNLGTGFAGTGVQRFNTNTTSMTANANGGDAYINETDNLSIGASDMNGGILDVVANGSFTTTGDISADVVSLDTTAANGSLTLNGNVTGTTSVTLEATGAGTVTQNAGRVGGGLVTIDAATNIGSAGNRFDTDAATLDASGGNVYIDELDGVTLAGGNTAVNTFDLTAAGNIAVTGDVTGNTVNLNTSGVNGTITVNGADVNGAVAVNLTTPGNGSVNLVAGGNLISINGTIGVTTDNIDLSGGTVNAGNGSVNLAAITGNRSIGLGGGAGLFNLTNAELNNITADNLTIGNNLTTGAMTIDAVNLTAVDTALHLRTAGTIADAVPGDDTTPNIILANNRNLSFDGAGGLGTGQIANPGLADLDVQIGGTGVLSVNTNNADAYINLTNGGLVGNFDVGTAGFELSADAGSILDGNGAANNFTAGSDSTLTASGTIGTDTNPLEVNIVGGDLFVDASGIINGVSVNIDGVVMPTNDVTTVGGPPGLVIFNGGASFTPPPPPSSGGPSTFDPGPSLQVVDAIASIDPSLLTQPVTVVVSTGISDDSADASSPVRTEDMLNATVAYGSGSFTYEDKDTGQLDYVANAATDKVYVIMPLGDQIIKMIPVGSTPNAIIVNRGLKTAYVANSGSNTVSVISTTDLEVVVDIPVGQRPEGLTLSPDGNKLYVANNEGNSISVIDTRTNQVVQTIKGNLNQPSGVDMAPDGKTLYVSNTGSNTVSVIDTQSGEIRSDIVVGSNPQALAVNPNGKEVYVINTFDGTMSIIDTASGNVTQTVAVGPTPYGISVSRDGAKVYVADMSETNITVFNSDDFSIQATISGNRIPLRFNIDSLNEKAAIKPLKIGARLETP